MIDTLNKINENWGESPVVEFKINNENLTKGIKKFLKKLHKKDKKEKNKNLDYFKEIESELNKKSILEKIRFLNLELKQNEAKRIENRINNRYFEDFYLDSKIEYLEKTLRYYDLQIKLDVYESKINSRGFSCF